MHKIVNGELIELTFEEAVEMTKQWDEEVERQRKIAYRVNRVAEYPSIGDQLDVIWKFLATNPNLDGNAKMMYNVIKDIKEKYPKPE